MKNTIFLFFLSLLSAPLFSQKEAAIWYFGYNAGVDFNSGTPVALTDGALHTDEGCSTISDPNGNLLFYTDGITVWNRNHDIMPNGTGLFGSDDSTQSGLIVPRPGSPDIYYIFTTDKQAGDKGMCYSEVDMGLDGGLGDVTSVKNINLIPRSLEKVTAVKNRDGSGIWVIGHPWDSNRFNSFLVTAAGIDMDPVESITTLTLTNPPGTNGTNASVGQLKVSPDGNKIAMCTATIGTHVFDFDPQNGIIGNTVQISDRKIDYGVEFSPSGKVLYVGSDGGTYEGGKLYQYDMEAMDIGASETLIAAVRGLGFALQLAIDGKIYTPDLMANLSSIDNPDVLGPGCNFNHKSVDLAGRWARAGLPPFIQSYFYVDLEIKNLCLGDLTEFRSGVSGTITSIDWDFGDGGTSTLENPTHTYASPGTYVVSVTATTGAGTRTETKDITIYPMPMANTVGDFGVCSPEPTYVFDLATKDAEILGGQSATDFSVDYYPTQLDAQNGTNKLPDLYTNTSPTETVFAKIYSPNGPTCNDITHFDLIVKQAPISNTVTDWAICDTDPDGLYGFDLAQKDAEVLGGQNAGTFSVNYFGSQDDADNGTGALSSPYTNTGSPQRLFFRIENTDHPECYATGSFRLEVITGVTAHAPKALETCDDDNDGISTFDLTVNDSDILGGQNPTGYGVSYHRTQLDADAGTNAINGAIGYTNTVPYTETVYARVENKGNPDCYGTTSFELRVYDLPTKRSVSDWQVCDGDNDGTYYFDLAQKNAEILGDRPSTDFTITYHETRADAMTGRNAITDPYQNTSDKQPIFYRVENNANKTCFLTDSFTLRVFGTPTAIPPVPIVSCDVDGTGTQTFELGTKDTEVLGGQNADIYDVSYYGSAADADADQDPLSKTAYINSAQRETIFVRIQNKENPGCYDIASFGIMVNPLPRPQIQGTYAICPDSPELTVDAGDFESWTWRDGNNMVIGTDRTLDITELGDYSLTVARTMNGVRCESTVPFTVISSGAPEGLAVNVSGFSDRVALKVEASGTGEFEYSLDGENFRDGDRFEVFPGEYTVYVRDRSGCRTLSKEVLALGHQRFFTPNGDGSNEYWRVIGMESYPGSQLYIFDRYGKLLEQLSPTGPGWDGTYNGRRMPSGDYWFRFVLDGGKALKGHFTLKR